jgi:hypothetical protein
MKGVLSAGSAADATWKENKQLNLRGLTAELLTRIMHGALDDVRLRFCRL